jgi:hypothetical protein
MLSKTFWLQAFERAVKSAAQALLLLWGADQFFDAMTVDWQGALGVAAGAAVLSVLTSLVSVPVGQSGSPSMVKAPLSE